MQFNQHVFSSKSSISFSISDVRNDFEYLLTGKPSGLTKNFSKFQDISDRFTGFHIIELGLSIKASFNEMF